MTTFAFDAPPLRRRTAIIGSLRLVDWPLLFLLVTLPLQWINLTGAGNLNFKLQHVAALIMGSILLVRKQWRRDGFEQAWRAARMFLLSYVLYVAAMLATLLYSHQPDAFSTIIKIASYAGFGLLVTAYISALPLRKITITIYVAALCTFIVFGAVLTIKGWNQNLLSTVISAMLRGDVRSLEFKVFGIIVESGGLGPSVAIRHMIDVAIITINVMALILRPAIQREFPHWSTKYLIWTLSLIALAFVFVSVSRESILAILLMCLSASSLALFRTRKIRRRYALGAILALACGSLFILAVPQKLVDGISDITRSRTEQLSKDGRIAMYGEAIDRIEYRPISGYGVGTKIDAKGHQVHNFILNAWFESGLLGFVCASLAFLMLAYKGLEAYDFSLGGRSLYFDLLWLPGLVLLPMVRALVGGDGGNPQMPDWVSIAGFMILSYRARQCETLVDRSPT